MRVYIKPNSWIAWIAAKKLGEKRAAIVINKSIYLWNVSSEDFMSDEKWLRHEAVHVDQYRRHGILKFLFLYLMQSIKHGYRNNALEKEAREKENDENVLANLHFTPK